ncbi:MAG TPA: hypothetical protein VJ276_14695, partial [Thermoanaerobaculia bacterium]|nr:hypothetical protein [Thermoanaerobaculia bacterium]
MKRLAALAVLLLAARAAHAQAVHPNWEKGIAAEKAYEFGDLDTVNLFNGNLNVGIPIGQTYHLGGNLSYGFTLHYGGNSWEFGSAQRTMEGETKNFVWAFPGHRQNAGFGWRLSLGELTQDLPCAPGPVAGGAWAYVAPDGGTHCPRAVPHPNGSARSGIYYSADGSYLRLDTRNPFQLKLEFPDGTYHTFDDTGRLIRMDDRFGNWVTVAYYNDSPGNAPRWHITDSAGREHDVFFKNTATYVEDLGFGADVDHLSVSEVRLAAAGGQTASYVFHYEGEANGTWSVIPRHPIDVSGEVDPNLPFDTAATLLTSIDLPEGALSWNMQYERCTAQAPGADCPDASGSLKSLLLPTGGQLSWTYQQFALPGAWFQQNPNKPIEGTLYSTPVAVETRTMTYNGSAIGLREYAQELVGNLGVEHRVLVTDHAAGPGSPIIRRTRSYFSICSMNCEFGYPGEYGLPLSRRPASNEESGWSISSEDIGPDANGNWNTPLRRRFVQYEADIHLPNAPTSLYSDYNRRVAAERTRYEDNKTADTFYDHFDGLGHYRETRTAGTFGSRDVRATFTNYNPPQGDFKAFANNTYNAYTQFPVESPWILNTFDYETASETLPAVPGAELSSESKTSMTEVCFDATGFLTHRRTLQSNVAAPSSPPRLGTDLLAVFTKDARGNIATEQYFGGDGQPAVPPSLTCPTPALTGEAFSLVHTWAANGALLTSKYTDAGGNQVGPLILKQEADASTGFITKSYDSADVATAITYDRLGRVTSAAPSGTLTVPRSATTNYAYSINPPTVTIAQTTGETVPPLPFSSLVFDGFGRLERQQKTMPNGTLSVVQTDYNSLGWKTRVSEAEESPSHFTTYSYDALGRPREVTAPDKSHVNFAYIGASQTARTVKVHTGDVDEDSTTTETYDRQGKLWKVTEPNGVVTSYTYDIGNRLRSVCMDAGVNTCGQKRIFTYDNRGFLGSEVHPEKTTSYDSYDARGHALHRVDGNTHLSFEYDRAERLRTITDPQHGPVKQFDFGAANTAGNYAAGKVVRAVRNNWVDDTSTTPPTTFNFQVVENYVYGGRDGRASTRTTQQKTCVVVTGQEDCTGVLPGGGAVVSFSTGFSQDPLGSPSTIVYPSCTFAPCNAAVAGAPTITNRYRRGMLEGVDTPGNQTNSLDYASNGLVTKVAHANLVTDWQTPDPDGMRRPYMISVTGAKDASSCTAVTIAAQPASTTATSGSATLSATINGDSDTAAHPISLQWYQGASPSTAQPVGGATTTVNAPGSVTSSLPVALSATTSYWLRASNNCGPSADSVTATVAVCETVAINGQPSGTTVISGQTATISVSATGSSVQHQWYQGASGVTTTPIADATSYTLSFIPTQTASYWVRVSNGCGSAANSNAVTVTVTPPAAPTGLVAAYQTGGILVSWNAAAPLAGVRNYVLQRRYDRLGYRDYRTLGAGTLSYLDTDAVAAHGYAYRVRVVDGNGVASLASAPDAAVAMGFTDDPVTAGVTLISVVHFSEMRKAIDALRDAAGLAPVWTSYSPLTGTVLAVHVSEMRAALDAARSGLGMPTMTYPTPAVTAGTPIL